MSSDMSLNFGMICRTCMTQSQALTSIFDKQDSSPNDVASMLQSITTIQPIKNDGLPENVCIGCLNEINRAFSFKNLSERSESTLRTIREHLIRLNEKSIDDSGPTCDEQNYEIIEVDDEQHPGYPTNLGTNLKTEIENDETLRSLSPNILDRRKVFVLTSNEKLPDPINVVYECHICYDTFESFSLSEQHMMKCHLSDCKKEHGTSDRVSCPACNLFVDANISDQHIPENHRDDNDTNGDDKFCYETEEGNMANVIEVDETLDECDNEDGVQESKLSEDEITKDENVPVIVGTKGTMDFELKFYCKKCGGKFAKERSLNIHIKLNKCTIKSFECKVCNKVFVRKKNLDCHMKTHAGSSDFSCKVCSEKFTRADKLAMHIQTKHEPSRKHLCPYCWKGFNVSSSLKDHIRIHNGERPYLCSICGKGFSQSTNLNQHVMRHNKTKPYSCKVCSYSFVSKGELSAHSRKHSGVHPFVCEVCSASFTTSSSLVKHTRIHTGERPYACNYCPMRFAALGTLKNHTRTHNGARPFACGICGRTFSQRSDCLSHQDTHSAEKTFFCQQCYKSFHKKSGLRNHMKTHQMKDCSEPLTNSSKVVSEID